MFSNSMNSNNQFKLELAFAPNAFHFIWVGGPIKETYLSSILKLAEVAKASGFSVNLWVDDEKNYRRTLHKMHPTAQEVNWLPQQIDHALGITLRKIDELYPKMEKDSFYRENPMLLRQFCYAVNREMIGFKNLAAASDLLRLEILRQEGGCYFDTDTQFRFNKGEKIIPEPLLCGFKAAVTVHWGSCRPAKNECYVAINDVRGCNDIIVSIPQHPILEQCLVRCLKNYTDLDKKVIQNGDEHGFSNRKTIRLLGMDIKRNPYFKKDRRKKTIGASGPDVLLITMRCFLQEQFKGNQKDPGEIKGDQEDPGEKIHSIEMTSQVIEENGLERRVSILFGMRVCALFDNTWLKRSAKIHSFDTSIPHSLFAMKKQIKQTSTPPPQNQKSGFCFGK